MMRENVMPGARVGGGRSLLESRLGSKRAMANWLVAFGALALVTVAELITTYGDPRFGVGMHIAVLVLCLCLAALSFDVRRQAFFLTLSVAPIIRIVSTGMPLRSFPEEYWYLLTSIPLFIAAFFIAGAAGLGLSSLNLRLPERRYLPVESLVWASGLGLGCIEWLILRPEPLVGERPFAGLVGAGLILLVCTGFVEELLFRGLVQHAAGRLLGARSGLLFTAGLFAVLHIGHRSAADVVFVAGVGIYFSLVVQCTRSLLGVTLAHGTINTMLFIVLPLALASNQRGPGKLPTPPILAQRAIGIATITGTPIPTGTHPPTRTPVLATATATRVVLVAARHKAAAPAPTSTSTPVPPTSSPTSTLPPPTSSPTSTPVPPTGTPLPGRIVLAGGLALSGSSVSAGQSLTAWVTVRNAGGRGIRLGDIVIAARPPHGTNAGGPFDDFGGTDGMTLAAGQTIQLRKVRRFTAADPAGTWYAFVTYQAVNGVWHDDPADVHFTVGRK